MNINNCEYIHETVVRDIVDVITDVKKSEQIQGIFNRGRSFKSVAQASSNLVLVFPVITTNTIDIKTASMICKAIERKAVSMLQMLFAAVSITDSDNAIDYLRNFHTNLHLDNDMTVDQFIDAVDKFVIQQESAGIVTITDQEAYNSIMADLKNLNYTLPEDICDSSINDYKIYPQSRYGKTSIVKEAVPYAASKNASDVIKNRAEIINKQILDSDVKKANELIPTSMIINFVSLNGDSPIGVSDAVIGVKAKLYPVDSTDIINRIKLKNEDSNGFNKFIRAATREISFWKDFVFAIDKAKLDAISSSRRGSSSKMWKVLERRALKSRIRRTLGQTNDASAITTLVISQEEVEQLKKYENINVLNERVMRPIMEAYNLMGVCVVDESMETAKFLFDTGDDMYETLSFSHLERESSDSSYKKVINLMTKLSR